MLNSISLIRIISKSTIESDLLNETEYGIAFPSAIERNNIFGVQYHPEKSHRTGVQVLKNFIDM